MDVVERGQRVKKRGRFFVLEGIDGAGTTTQVARLRDRLAQHGLSVRSTCEPSQGPVGAMIRQVLSGRIVLPGRQAPGWATMALLFAADRLDHVDAEIAPYVADGGIVISDRYDASSLAYQSVTSGGDDGAIDWIRSLNRYAMRPDLTVVLDVGSERAAERRSARGQAAELYERNEVQQALAIFYRNLPSHMPTDRIVVLDGAGSIDEVTERILAVLMPLIEAP